MMAIPLIMMAVSVAGTVYSSVEQSRNLKMQEQAARLNESYQRDQAKVELATSAQDAKAQRKFGARKTAEQATGFSQSGFGLGGSAGMSIEDSATAAEYDALAVQYKGVLKSRASTVAAQNYALSAEAAKATRSAIPMKTALGVATNLLSGYANFSRGAIA